MSVEKRSNGAQKKRVVLYLRVGRQSQVSVEVQQAVLAEKVKKHPDWELCGIYSDVGPASNGKRYARAFRHLLEDAGQGKFDRVLTPGITRITRDVPQLIEIVHLLKGKGVEIDFLKEGLSTDRNECEEAA